MNNKKILIIGGAGFIGINSAEKFVKESYEVTIFDNLSRKGVTDNLGWLKKVYPEKFNFVLGDVRCDYKLLLEQIESHDAVLHLAAQVAVTSSVIDPRNDFEINTLGTINVLEAIRESRNKPLLIYSSTNKVYGSLEDLSITETETRYILSDYPQGISEKQPLDFHSPYGCSKGSADQYVRDYARIYGLKTVVLRQSCIYGYHQFGIEDQGWIVWFIIAFLLKKKVFLYGNGKQVRDILFIDDLVNLYNLLINKSDQIAGKVYNVGGGVINSISILEFLEKLREDFKINTHYDVKEIRPGDQRVFISDNGALKKDLGWEPVNNIDQGIKKTIDWINANLPLIKVVY